MQPNPPNPAALSPHTFNIEARRTGGAGTVQIFWPEGGFSLVGPGGCTADGLG